MQKGKSITKRCNGKPYDIFGALRQAFYIKDGKTAADKIAYRITETAEEDDSVEQCKDSTDPKDCFCTPFDFAWMSAIAEAGRQIGNIGKSATETKKIISATTPKSEAAILAVAETIKAAMQKPNLTGFFTQINILMTKNIEKITQGNPMYVKLFCACLNKALPMPAAAKSLPAIETTLDDILKGSTDGNAVADKAAAMIIYNALLAIINMESTTVVIFTNDGVGELVEALKKQMEKASKAGPSVAGPSKAGPSKAGPSEAGPSEAGPSEAGPSEDTNELNQNLDKTVKLINIGNYVLNDSNQFDRAAFVATSETFNLFLPPEETMTGGGKKWDKFKENKWNILGGILTGCAVAAALVTPVGWAGLAIGAVVGVAKMYVNYSEKKRAVKRALEKGDAKLQEQCAELIAKDKAYPEDDDPPIAGPDDGGGHGKKRNRYLSQKLKKKKYITKRKRNTKYKNKYKKQTRTSIRTTPSMRMKTRRRKYPKF
jgi:hypothetical protein